VILGKEKKYSIMEENRIKVGHFLTKREEWKRKI
jgi:hypothetical protein